MTGEDDSTDDRAGREAETDEAKPLPALFAAAQLEHLRSLLKQWSGTLTEKDFAGALQRWIYLFGDAPSYRDRAGQGRAASDIDFAALGRKAGELASALEAARADLTFFVFMEPLTAGRPVVRRTLLDSAPEERAVEELLSQILALRNATEKAETGVMPKKRGRKPAVKVKKALKYLAYLYCCATGDYPGVSKQDGGRGGQWYEFAVTAARYAWPAMQRPPSFMIEDVGREVGREFGLKPRE